MARPARVILTWYSIGLIAGTAALMLPIARAGRGGAEFLDALFTAASAVCITGLIVVDTPNYWTPVGHVIILILMQVGGIGIMTFASVLGLSVMRRHGLRTRLSTAGETRQVDLGDLRRLMLSIVKISFAIQAVVAVAVFCRLLVGYDDSVLRSAWLAVFHSASAFNNGGFALHSDSLMRYAGDAWLLLPFCGGIILGGLGYPVLVQLRREFGSPLHWSMNTRIVLMFTGVLLVIGTLFTLGAEWRNENTVGPMSFGGKLLASFTHSTMTRSAGFNTVDTSQMDTATWLGSDVLMFIGAGPAGTAGGIKLTTFAVLYFIIYTEIRSRRAVNVLGKRLSRSTHRQAISVALLAVATVVTSTLVLMLATDFTLDENLFEVISAFGTVGLSTGITSDLPAGGQLLLIALMFIGRLGPITLATALVFRERPPLYEYPKERPILG